jgi:UPF0755 protein
VRSARRLLLPILLCTLGGAAAFITVMLNIPYAGFANPVFVEFPKGTNTVRMAAMLRRAGVIRYEWPFLVARVVEPNVSLQAGEYRFAHRASVRAVFGRIARGDIFYYELVVPEGRNMFDIAASLERLGLFPAAQFLGATRHPAVIRDLDPRAPTLEGYLFPSTYRLSRHITPDRVCLIMTAKFRDVWRSLASGADPHHVVTLASLVEKEGKLPDERPVIASVFLRRLAIGMKLDCDPTTIYAALLSGTYSGVIRRSDLASEDSYNTYRHAGLPPGPIANPGMASIQAVLHPADTRFLYFVLRPDGSGGHNFSTNLDAQTANISKYRHSVAH